MKRTLGFVIMAGLLAPSLAAQNDVSARLAGRLPRDVAAAVAAVVDSATTSGLPTDPLVNKALEGAVKGVPGERIVAAVRMVLQQLNTAAAALGGAARADAAEITAGAFAISAGLDGNEVSEVATTAGTSYSAATALQVAGTLVALGVPPAASVNLVDATIKAGGPVADLVTLPSQVQAAMAQGAPPAAVAAGLARAAAAHAAPRPPHPEKGGANTRKP